MADQTQRLEIATVKAEIASDILSRFSNEAVGAVTIPTDSGAIPNLKQVISTIQEDGAEKISFATTIYPTTAAGIAATTDGAIFLVKSVEDDEVYAVWQNVASVPTDTGKRALSAQAIQEAMTAADASADESAASALAAQEAATNAAAEFETLFETDQARRIVEFNNFLNSSGYEPPIPYVPGILLDRTTKTVTYLGNEYRTKGSFIPFTTSDWVTDEPKLKLIGDDSLRQNLADPDNFLVGWERQTQIETDATVAKFLNAQNVSAWEFAHLIPLSSKPNPTDPTTWDWELALNAAAATCSVAKIPGFTYPQGSLSKTVFLPAGVAAIGPGRNAPIKPMVGATFTQGFMFLCNTTDGLTPTVNFTNNMAGALLNTVFWNGDVAGVPTVPIVRGVRAFGSWTIQGLRGRNMAKMVHRPGGPNVYSDHFDVSDIYCEPVIGAEPQVDIQGGGDGLRVGKLHFPWNAANPGSGTPFALSIAGAYGGSVSECIGGDTFITQGKLELRGNHWERAQVTIDGANVDLRSNYLSADTRIPLVLLNSSGHECIVTSDSTEFVYTSGITPPQEWQGSDISIATGVTLIVRNSYRRYTRSGSLDKSQQHGLTLETSGGVPMTAWNKYSYALSRSGQIFRGQVVDQNFSIAPLSSSFAGISGIAVDSTETWDIASGTFYYRSQYILDTGRLVGRTSTAGEQSIALTSAGSGARISVDFNGKPTTCILRMYRGTTAGSYSHYVDIPIFSARLFYDSGLALNGYPWQSRTPGAIDTLNGLGETYFEMNGPNVLVRAATTPTVGAWLAADNIERTNPSPGGKEGWVLPTAGSPGPWRGRGSIELVITRGVTGSRPALGASDYGVLYMDTSLAAAGKPIWWTGTVWVDATGTAV